MHKSQTACHVTVSDQLIRNDLPVMTAILIHSGTREAITQGLVEAGAPLSRG